MGTKGHIYLNGRLQPGWNKLRMAVKAVSAWMALEEEVGSAEVVV